MFGNSIEGERGAMISGCEDDGEIHAGSRMLHLLEVEMGFLLNLLGQVSGRVKSHAM